MAQKETASAAQKDVNMLPEIKKGKGGVMVPLLAAALIVVIGVAIYFYWQTIQLQKNPQNVAQQQVNSIIAKVSRLILLPTGENPTIATVTNPSLLAGQAFFANTKKGDEILIYTNAKEAILYRPSTDMIINVAPLNIGSSTTGPATSAATPTAASTTTTTTSTSTKH